MTTPPTRASWKSWVALLVAAGLLLGACSDDNSSSSDTSEGSTDRQAVVTALVDGVIAPLVRDASTAAGAAAEATEAYCTAPTPESQQAAIDAVDAALFAYEQLDPIDMGPITLRRTDGHVAYPLDAERLEELLAGQPPTDPESIDKRTPSSVRGLSAAEYLLMAQPAPADDPMRCTFLVAVTANAVDSLRLVEVDAFEGSDSESAYYQRLTGVAADADPPKETIDVIVNMVMTVLDADAGLLADPGDQTERSVRRAASAHVATVDALWGGGSDGLSQLVDPALAERVTAEIDAARRALDDDAVSAGEARAAVEELRATIGTEVVSALDVVVGFSENDGDS